MGSYCDRCYTLCGSIRDENYLEKFEHWDLCSDCHIAVGILVSKDIDKHEKLNNIGGC